MPYFPLFGVCNQAAVIVLQFTNMGAYSEDPLIYDYQYEASDVVSYWDSDPVAWLIGNGYVASDYVDGEYICVFDSAAQIWFIVIVEEA